MHQLDKKTNYVDPLDANTGEAVCIDKKSRLRHHTGKGELLKSWVNESIACFVAKRLCGAES